MEAVPGGPMVVKVGILSRGDSPSCGPTDSEFKCKGNGGEEGGGNEEEGDGLEGEAGNGGRSHGC